MIPLVRAGVGADAEPMQLVSNINRCAEVTTTVPKRDMRSRGRRVPRMLHAWELTGALDDEGRLTALGVWLVPRSLLWPGRRVSGDRRQRPPSARIVAAAVRVQQVVVGEDEARVRGAPSCIGEHHEHGTLVVEHRPRWRSRKAKRALDASSTARTTASCGSSTWPDRGAQRCRAATWTVVP